MTQSGSYFDTSALVKLVLRDEDGADLALSIYTGDDLVITSMLSYVEAHSALARRFRNHEIDEQELSEALARLRFVWSRFETVSVDDAYILAGAELLSQFPLSGADAVQVASALGIDSVDSLTFVTWDRRQAEAADALGFTVQPPID